MYLSDQCAVQNENQARSSRCCAVFGHFLYCFASFDSRAFKFSATSDGKGPGCVAAFCAMRAFLVAAHHFFFLNRALTIDPIISCPRERCVIAGNVENIKRHVKNVFQALLCLRSYFSHPHSPDKFANTSITGQFGGQRALVLLVYYVTLFLHDGLTLLLPDFIRWGTK